MINRHLPEVINQGEGIWEVLQHFGRRPHKEYCSTHYLWYDHDSQKLSLWEPGKAPWNSGELWGSQVCGVSWRQSMTIHENLWLIDIQKNGHHGHCFSFVRVSLETLVSFDLYFPWNFRAISQARRITKPKEVLPGQSFMGSEWLKSDLPRWDFGAANMWHFTSKTMGI